MRQSDTKTMNLILVLIGIAVLIFTISMIWLYKTTNGIPDTLCNCFYIACTGECGFMGWIKTTKENNKKRAQQLEDEERQIKRMKEMENN